MRLGMCCVMFVILGTALLVTSGYAADFSADIVNSTPEGSFTAKIYVSGDKSRVEMAEAITISRIDKKVVWVLMPQQRMYMEQPLDLHSTASTQEKMDGEIERKVEGNETVNGRNTTKYRVTFEVQERQESVFQWIDEASHIPVKTAAIDGSWSNEFKNIQSGPQNQELFEIPAEYQKMAFGM